jgi:hypothetical protein
MFLFVEVLFTRLQRAFDVSPLSDGPVAGIFALCLIALPIGFAGGMLNGSRRKIRWGN